MISMLKEDYYINEKTVIFIKHARKIKPGEKN